MAVVLNKGVYVIAGKRTPFGKYGGALRDIAPEELFAVAAKAAFGAGRVSPSLLDSVNIGQISSMSPGAMAARHAALKAGVPSKTPVLGINNLSGSAISAIITSAQEILIGSARVSLAGGMEVLSGVPFLVRGARFGIPLGKNIQLDDMDVEGLIDTYCNMTIMQTADKLAKECGLGRREVDEFALRSQRRWKAAHDNGIFQSELAPVVGKVKGQEVMVTRDESPRTDTSIESLTRLPPLYEGGVVTAGNSCGINDGAAAVILASEKAVKEDNLKPLVRLVGWSNIGVDPALMGIGAVPAARVLLAAAGLKLEDMDLVEIHETYASQALACAKELNVEDSKLNVNGGAIAIGHPSGASGARIVSHLTHELRRRQLKRGIASMSIAGGQGVAVILETVN